MDAKPSLAHIENAASRVMQGFIDACDRRDATAIRELVSPRYKSIDRRRNVSESADTPTGTIAFLEQTVPVVATRGNRLALVRTRLLKPEDESERLVVVEIDESEELTATVSFDLGDLELAMAELDVRFTSGEASAHTPIWNTLRRARQAIRRQDWESLVALSTEDSEIRDHRPLRARELYGIEESIEDFRAIYSMSTDAKVLVRHVIGISDRGCLMIGEWRGTMDGGVFELLTATVVEFAADARIVRTDHHDLDQLEEARERYAALL